jgi:signal transduction histidine kinase
MKSQHTPIEINFADNQKNFIYYKDSIILTQLKYYPYFQLLVIALFLLVSYIAFSTSRKAEQNQVWVGMAKETAHQLGTPLSSLIAWLEIIKAKTPDDEFVIELEKDVQRLSTITDRFSKIGSAPALKKENLTTVIENAIGYIRTRSSSKVIFSLENAQQYDVEAPLNIALFDWVLENIFKNAIDSMSGEGNIHVKITDQQQFAYIDISDTGKGIPKSKYKDVFKPGFTSKSRGWGLGLSLSKRIVEEYHEGQIFVKSSELNKGTTFRIVLKKVTS